MMTTHPTVVRARGRGAAVVVVILSLALVACTGAQEDPTPEPTTTAAPSPTPDPEPTSPPEPTPSPTPEPDPFGDGAANILLLGTDSREPGDLTGQADTIVLVHLPADRENAYLISFTRDMWVDIPGLGEGKLNSAFARGGTDTLMETVSDLLGGVEIDLAVQSNFAGFIALTRAMDGFTVDNPIASSVVVQSTGREVVFPEGEVLLENTDGLIYVRQRYGLPLGDLDRAARQRAALQGMMARVVELSDDPEAMAGLLPVLLQNVKITGDFTVAEAESLLPLLEQLGGDDVVGLMVPITGFGDRQGQSVNVVDEAQTDALGEALKEDDVAGYVDEYGTEYAP